MQVERTNSDALVVNKLPDGSRVIVDSASERVFALNATAGAAWDACSSPTTLSRITKDMQHSLDPAITEELAQDAILQLQEQKLVKTSGSSSQVNRRDFMATLSAAALPLVVSLTMADQRAYANSARSVISSPRPEPFPIHPGQPTHADPHPIHPTPHPIHSGSHELKL
jgi:Coenzyme PQQ synthesis protein D (PqqD)